MIVEKASPKYGPQGANNMKAKINQIINVSSCAANLFVSIFHSFKAGIDKITKNVYLLK